MDDIFCADHGFTNKSSRLIHLASICLVESSFAACASIHQGHDNVAICITGVNLVVVVKILSFESSHKIGLTEVVRLVEKKMRTKSVEQQLDLAQDKERMTEQEEEDGGVVHGGGEEIGGQTVVVRREEKETALTFWEVRVSPIKRNKKMDPYSETNNWAWKSQSLLTHFLTQLSACELLAQSLLGFKTKPILQTSADQPATQSSISNPTNCSSSQVQPLQRISKKSDSGFCDN